MAPEAYGSCPLHASNPATLLCTLSVLRNHQGNLSNERPLSDLGTVNQPFNNINNYLNSKAVPIFQF